MTQAFVMPSFRLAPGPGNFDHGCVRDLPAQASETVAPERKRPAFAGRFDPADACDQLIDESSRRNASRMSTEPVRSMSSRV